jgi:hypothetical protein
MRKAATKITERMDCSLSFPTARYFAVRIKETSKNKPIASIACLDLEQAKGLRKVLDWAIARMELAAAQEARFGPSGCVEDNWPSGEYEKHLKECLAIDERYGMAE